MSAFGIRATTHADIPAVTSFINISWVRTYAPLIGEDVAHDLATAKHTQSLFEREIGVPDAVSFVAIDAAQNIIGHVGGFQKIEGAIYIDRFHIAPDWQGRKVAGALMEASANHAKDIGFERFELTVLEGNDRALAFYAKVGFVQDLALGPVEGMGGKHAIPLTKRL